MYTIEDELNIDAGKHVLAMFSNQELFWSICLILYILLSLIH